MKGDNKRKILLLLLRNHKGDLTKYKIHKIVGCSYPWAIMLLNELQKKGFVKGTEVIDYKGLLEEYRRVFKQFKSAYFYVPNFKDLLRSADKKKLDYALTTYLGESVVHGFLFPSKFELYINEEDLDKWTQTITKEVNGGIGKGNVTLFLANKEFLKNTEKIKEVNVIAIPQLIVDLLNEGHVCVQAAEMMLEKWKVI